MKNLRDVDTLAGVGGRKEAQVDQASEEQISDDFMKENWNLLIGSVENESKKQLGRNKLKKKCRVMMQNL